MTSTRKRRFPWGLTLVAAALIGGGAWYLVAGGPLGEKKPDPAAALIAKAERRNIDSSLLLSGEVIPAVQVDVKPEVGGKVGEILVKVSQFVRKGELLAVIDDRDLQTEKRTAETAIEGAQLSVDKNQGNYDRAKALFEEKLISKEVFANLEADLLISKNALERAQSQLQTVNDKLAKTRIVAPADGTVLDIAVNEGQVVTAAASVNSGTTLMTFADLSRLLVETHVNQMDVAKLSAGQEVQVHLQGDDSNTVKARIEFVAPLATVKNNIKGFQVQALIEDDRGLLKPGMSVSMVASVGSAKDAVAVPISGVFKQNNDRVVYVRKAAGATERRKVSTGLTNMSFVEIKDGLREGEEILLVEPRASTPSS